MSSSVRRWVLDLPWMQQGVLFSALRSADGVPHNDLSKIIVRGYRNIILKPAKSTGSFLGKIPNDNQLVEAMERFVDGFGEYNVHFVLHLVHAAEIVGYKYPDSEQLTWLGFYSEMCRAMHVNPETEDQMDKRLYDDPVVVMSSEEMEVDQDTKPFS